MKKHSTKLSSILSVVDLCETLITTLEWFQGHSEQALEREVVVQPS